MLSAAVIIGGTIALLYLSRNSLLNLNTHGFYRFFVFESCLILIVLNFSYWFTNPFSFLQIVSWALLFVSLYLVAQSALFLKKFGGHRERENSPANLEFENTAELVKEGIYKHIRHPMYASLLFLSLGAFLKNISVLTFILTLIAVIFVIITAKSEEKENIKFFGQAYLNYKEGTKMFIPKVL